MCNVKAGSKDDCTARRFKAASRDAVGVKGPSENLKPEWWNLTAVKDDLY